MTLTKTATILVLSVVLVFAFTASVGFAREGPQFATIQNNIAYKSTQPSPIILAPASADTKSAGATAWMRSNKLAMPDSAARSVSTQASGGLPR